MKGWEMDERNLARRCLNGDGSAQKELYDFLSPMLMGVCRRYLGRSPYVGDVFQDGFISIFGCLNKFEYRGEGSLPAWAKRVMANTALKWLRSQPAQPEDEPDLTQIREPSEEEAALVPEEKIREFIADLPEGYRTVFNLYVFEDYTHKEIGRMLGISERTSSSQLFRAKQLLAKKINNYIQDGTE